MKRSDVLDLLTDPNDEPAIEYRAIYEMLDEELMWNDVESTNHDVDTLDARDLSLGILAAFVAHAQGMASKIKAGAK